MGGVELRDGACISIDNNSKRTYHHFVGRMDGAILEGIAPSLLMILCAGIFTTHYQRMQTSHFHDWHGL